METEIICGSDYELIREKVKILLQKMGREQHQIEKINLEENNFATIIKKLTVRSFWEETVLIIEHLEVYRKLGKKQRERIEKAINYNHLPKILIWYKKTKSALENLPFKGKLHELKTFTNTRKKQKITKFFSREKIPLASAKVVEVISDCLPNNTEIVERNLEKIKHYYESTKEALQIADLEFLLDKTTNMNVFAVVEGLILKKPEIVIQKQIEQLATPNKNLLLWLKLLNLYTKTIIEIKVYYPKLSILKIAKNLKKNPVFVRKMLSFIHIVDLKWLLNIMEKVQEWEFKFRKWGLEKDDMIKLFVLELYE